MTNEGYLLRYLITIKKLMGSKHPQKISLKETNRVACEKVNLFTSYTLIRDQEVHRRNRRPGVVVI